MKLELRSFHTKVARRVFVLFVTCAVVPIVAFAWIAFSQTAKQIQEQSQNRLAQDAKAMGMSVLERLVLLGAEIRVVASRLSVAEGRAFHRASPALAERLQERFASVALLTGEGTYISILGTGDMPRELSRGDMAHLRAKRTLLRHRARPNGPAAVYMYAALDPAVPERGILMAEVMGPYLWQVASGRPAGTELYLVDRAKNVLFASAPDTSGIAERWPASPGCGHRGIFEWSDTAGVHVAAYWSIFLEPNFLAPEWCVLLRQAKDEALGPMIEFRRAFPPIIVISLCVVCLLSFHLIRKNSVPIETLTDATRRIAQGAFGHTVEIRSGDEFENLGNAFNDMSRKLREGRTLLVRAAKLSTIGQMAAGVIHEVKQPLTAISGLLQLAMLADQTFAQRKNLETALEAVGRLNAILERFRSFSRMSQEKMQIFSLGPIIAQVQALMEHQLRIKEIRCAVHAEESLPPVLGDEQGLHQVFSNLVINAVQAMEDKEEGPRILDIRLKSSEGKVLVEVEDTGCGMSPDVVEHMFDPFFTTKDRDRGTGLGMAIVESILHTHGATIEVKSRLGAGTTVVVAFPSVPPEGSPRARAG